MGGVPWYKLVVYILLSAREGILLQSIAIGTGGVSRYFSTKVSGSRLDLTLLTSVAISLQLRLRFSDAAKILIIFVFFDFLVFFHLQEIPCFLLVFLSFPRILGVQRREKSLFIWRFSLPFSKKQGKKMRENSRCFGPKGVVPPKSLRLFLATENASDCDAIFMFFVKRTSPLRFGWRRGGDARGRKTRRYVIVIWGALRFCLMRGSIHLRSMAWENHSPTHATKKHLAWSFHSWFRGCRFWF